VGGEHIISHRQKVLKTGATGIHSRGGARRQAHLVRMYRNGVAAVVEMSVEVDKPRRNQFAGYVNSGSARCWVYAFRHLGN